MILDIPLVTQNPKSFDCGPACVAMMLQYYGRDASVESLKEEIELYDGEWKGSYMPQLAIPFLKRGFKARIVTMDPRYFCYGERLSQEAIRERLEEYEKATGAKGELARLMIAFLDAGGEFETAIPSREHLEAALEKNNPVCALLTTRFLSADTPGYNQHFIIIKGLEDDKALVNDPVTGLDGYHGEEQEHPIDALLYGVHACAAEGLDNGCFLIVEGE